MRLDDWFLAAGERGNSHTAIDHRHGDVPWTEGNLAEVLIDGRQYFSSLLTALRATGPGDSVYLTGLEGEADELLEGPGSEVAVVLAELAGRGVGVRGLVWRSHGASYSEEKNLQFSRAVNVAGGDVLLAIGSAVGEAIIRNSWSCATRADPARGTLSCSDCHGPLSTWSGGRVRLVHGLVDAASGPVLQLRKTRNARCLDLDADTLELLSAHR